MFHLFGLTILLATTIVLSLRLLGVMFPQQTFPELASSLMPWNLWSLAVMLCTGFLLFTSEAVKCYGNYSFRAKMVLLFTALLFRFALYPQLTRNWESWRRDYRWCCGFPWDWRDERSVSWDNESGSRVPGLRAAGISGISFHFFHLADVAFAMRRQKQQPLVAIQ